MSSLLHPNPETPDEREPLANIEAEQAVLGALLVNNETMLLIPNLLPAHFYEPVHRRLFDRMCSLWGENAKFDPITMKAHFETDAALFDLGSGKYLNQLAVQAASGIFRIVLYCEIIIEISERRELANVLKEACAWASNRETEDTAVEIATRVSADLSMVAAAKESSLFQNDAEVIELILNDLKSDSRPNATGYEKLDAAMSGGLYPGKSYGFAARKKMGKTILAGSISQNLNERGVRHLFICGEMSPAEVHKRTLGRLMRVKSGAFYDAGRKSSDFQQAIAAHAVASKKNIIYKNAPGLTFEDLKRYVLLARLQKKITGFILDYWQLVGGKRKGQSTAEHLDEVAQWIADTCRKYDLWSIVMAQINQEGNTRGGEGIRLAFDQVYVLRAPQDDAGRSERWLEMSDTRYTPWRSVGSENNPGFYLNEHGPHFSESAEMEYDAGFL